MSVMRLNFLTHRAHRSIAQGRGLALGIALLLGGCDTLSSINPFDRPEVYKPEIVGRGSGRQALQ